MFCEGVGGGGEVADSGGYLTGGLSALATGVLVDVYGQAEGMTIFAASLGAAAVAGAIFVRARLTRE